jgi:hypothetical protein
MRRLEFIALVGATIAWSCAAMAQEPGRIYRVGLVSPVECEDQPLTVGFAEGLRPLGFVKGQNFTIDCRKIGGDVDVSSRR